MELCKTIFFYVKGNVKVGGRTIETRVTRFRMTTFASVENLVATPNVCNN